jgi:hypothetical protein
VGDGEPNTAAAGIPWVFYVYSRLAVNAGGAEMAIIEWYGNQADQSIKDLLFLILLFTYGEGD